MNGPTRLGEPSACTEGELQEFARLVRQGFAGSDEGLGDRIRGAKWLAFHYTAGDTLGGIAALKAPTDRYREEVFRKADAPVSPTDYRFELGWVFVIPEQRGRRIAGNLCQLLLARACESCLFATTNPDNIPMIRILLALGFVRTGTAFLHQRRNEDLVMFLRSVRRLGALHSAT